jgi:hypothetical protein
MSAALEFKEAAEAFKLRFANGIAKQMVFMSNVEVLPSIHYSHFGWFKEQNSPQT